MILNRLEVENIASLKSKHDIDFKTSLQAENLFAITGPTGSGKSSLLASISLALYGKHYKEKLSPLELITLGSGNGQATLYFSYNGFDYRARWEGTIRKSNGELLKKPKSDRELSVLEDGAWTLSSKKTEEIIRLSFEQFCKTIILNQGEFSRFLNSDFKERKEILEKLTEDHQLVAMGELLNKDIRELDQAIQLKLSEIKGIESLSPEEHMALKEAQAIRSVTLKNYKQELGRVSSNLKLFSNIMQGLRERLTNIDRKKALSLSLAEKQKSYNLFKQEFEQIAQTALVTEQELRKWEPELIKADNSAKKIQYIKQELVLHQKNFKQKQDRHVELVSLEQKYQSDLKILHKEKQALLKMPEKDYIAGLPLDKLSELFLRYQRAVQDERVNLSEMVFQEKDLENLKRERKITQESLEQVTKELRELEQAKLEVLDPWQLKAEELDPTLNIRQTEVLNLKQVQSALKNKLHEKLELEKKLALIHQEANLLVLDLYNQEKKFAITQEKLKIYELATHINACQEASLKNHECVVCGTHFDKLPTNSYVEKAIQDDLLDEKNKQEELALTIEGLKQEKNRLNLTLNHTQEQVGKLKKEEVHELERVGLRVFDALPSAINEKEKKLVALQTAQKKFNEHQEEFRLKTGQKLDLEKKLQQLEVRQTEAQSLEKQLKASIQSKRDIILSLMQEMRPLIPLSFKIDEQVEKLEQFLKDCRELDKIVLGARHLDMNLENLHKEKINVQMELADIQKEISKKEKEIAFEQQQIADITKGLDPALMLKQFKDAQSASANALKLWQSKDKDQLSDLKDFEGRLKMAAEQIEDYAVQIKKSAMAWISDSEIMMKEKFSYFEQEKAYALFIQMTAERFHLNQVVDDYDINNLTLFFDEASKAEQKFLADVKELEQICIVAHTKLELFAQNEARSGELSKEIDSLQSKLNRKKNLYQVMGKDEFRTFLLSMVERQLLVLANSELKSLCGERYELVQTSRKNTMTPEFYVLDRWSGGLKRNIFTLSGGETFMISLALALGLAEMTRGQAEINCFFIDEGFGTLDQESIEEVLQVLLNMRAQGKQIGIISHIRALTDRIPVNIRLSKSSTGFSKLDYFYN